MQNFEKLGVFYLGKKFDVAADKLSEDLSLYPSKDLTTHAVCIGMTGSGKTGLCLSLLEEAIIDKIPIIAIDPKGDISNLLLSFENLNQESFLPWVSQEEADKKGLSLEQFADTTAQVWKQGIESWGQTEERIKNMHANADFRIYTPGSSAGISVSLLNSFELPATEILNDSMALSETVESSVTNLLDFIGEKESQPGEPAHTFISQIFMTTWLSGQGLTLEDLISRIQNPSFSKIGVMDLESFFSKTRRTKLALAINSFVASPKFKSWSEGQSIGKLGSFIYGEKGKPQVSIFSISHLEEKERMFFVSRLLNELVSWIRKQPGTSSLRAILYMDEIFGYFPPNGNPPSKKPMLTLLKQARAHGLGVMLATQNPVDLDYKGLSNTGTWFIGRLQTQNDKNRLIEGLKTTGTGATVNWDQLLSTLKQRVFVVHSVHANEPQIIQSRWALSYLRGPLTATHIAKLMAPYKNNKGFKSDSSLQSQPDSVESKSDLDQKAPRLPQGIDSRFYKQDQQSNFIPHLGANMALHFTDNKRGLDSWVYKQVIVPFTETKLLHNAIKILSDTENLNQKEEYGTFQELPGEALDLKTYKEFEKNIKDYFYQNFDLELWVVENEKIISNPGETENEFRGRLQHLLKEKKDGAIEVITKKYDRQIKMMENRIFKAQVKVEKEKSQLSQQKTNAAVDIGLSILTAVLGGRKGGLVSKARTAQRGVGRIGREKEDVSLAEDELLQYQKDLEKIRAQLEEKTIEIENQWDPRLVSLQTVKITPKKTDLRCQWLGLVWVGE